MADGAAMSTITDVAFVEAPQPADASPLYDHAAEAACIAAVMLDEGGARGVWRTLAPLLSPHHFHDPRHTSMWAALAAIQGRGGAVDVLTAHAIGDRYIVPREWFTQHGGVKPGELDIQGYGCDISDEAQVQDVIGRIHKRFGKIHVAVNSAGIVENYPATEYPTPKLKKLFDININNTTRTRRCGPSHYATRHAPRYTKAT